MSAPSTPPVTDPGRSRFDPRNPVPRKTEFYARATGAGQADTGRLVGTTLLGAIGAVAIAVFLPAQWLLAMPLLSMAMLGAWGLAQKKLSDLDMAHDEAKGLRSALGAAKTAAVTLGAGAAVIAVVGLAMALLDRE